MPDSILNAHAVAESFGLKEPPEWLTRSRSSKLPKCCFVLTGKTWQWYTEYPRIFKFCAGALLAFVFLCAQYATASHIVSPKAIVAHGWHTAQDFGRELNAVDKLRNYNQNEDCTMSSLDLHHAFGPMCTDRASLLEAMSGGGRSGWDMPYQCRSCDMQWFTLKEVCRILSRFDNIFFIGDSLLRHTAQAINVLIRGDLVNGGRATWRTDIENDPGCNCRRVFDEVGCIFWSAVNTEMVLAGDPLSIKCPAFRKLGLVEWIPALNYPLKPEVTAVLTAKFISLKPDGRTVFVIDHGNWNSFEIDTSMAWIEQLDEVMRQWMPSFFEDGVDFSLFPRLYITATAEGETKPEIFRAVQDNINLLRHIRAIRPYVRDLGYEYLGLYNMTVQATSPDGTHASTENNLMKAMMILNWMNMLDPPLSPHSDIDMDGLSTEFDPAIKGEYTQVAADSEAEDMSQMKEKPLGEHAGPFIAPDAKEDDLSDDLNDDLSDEDIVDEENVDEDDVDEDNVDEGAQRGNRSESGVEREV